MTKQPCFLVYSFLGICLNISALVLLTQTEVAAQTEIETNADASHTSIATNQATLSTDIFQRLFLTPELPPLHPTLPEPTPTVRLVLKLSERRVYIYQGETLQASYPVAIGRAGWETPTGTFTVMEMVENPGWINPFTGETVPPGADSPLGERWIGFWDDGNRYIGFHGTPTRESVGQAASHGCVRMYNEDVRELYKIVSLGTSVIVEP